MCRFTEYTVVGTVMPAIGLGVSQVLFSPSYQFISTEVRSQDCSSFVLGPTVSAMEAAQILVGPKPHVYIPESPQMLKADPSQLEGYSDIPHVLNLQN